MRRAVIPVARSGHTGLLPGPPASRGADGAADHAGGREETERRIAEVNGAAAPAVQTRGAPEDLGESGAGVGAARQDMPGLAGGGRQMVLRSQRRDRRDAGP